MELPTTLALCAASGRCARFLASLFAGGACVSLASLPALCQVALRYAIAATAAITIPVFAAKEGSQALACILMSVMLVIAIDMAVSML